MKVKLASLLAIGTMAVWSRPVSAGAEELRLITDGKLAAEKIRWQGEPRIGSDAERFVFGGRGVRLWAKKAALGDCELRATLSFDSFTHAHRDAAVVVEDCGYLRINSGRGQLEIDHSRMPFGFKPEIIGPVSDYFRGGRVFTVKMKRTGDVVSFYLDGKKLAEREVASAEPMQFGFYAGLGTMRFKEWIISADKFADPVEREYEVLFPSQTLFEGTQESYERIVGGGADAPLIEGRGYRPGKAAVYRIPALAVTKRGTILAFAEARASGYDHGNIKMSFKLEGHRLEVNVNAAAGRIRVEILDESGKPIPGFSGKDATEYEAVDNLRLKPAWKSNKDLSALKGRVVRIRFHLSNARLYAFQIQ